MGMFNNITTMGLIKRQSFIIPEATVLNMDENNQFILIANSSIFYTIILGCYIQNNGNAKYGNYNKLNLTQINGNSPDTIIGYIEESPQGIDNNQLSSMLINIRYNGSTKIIGTESRQSTKLYWETLPTSGDGDLTVTLLYFNLNKI